MSLNVRIASPFYFRVRMDSCHSRCKTQTGSHRPSRAVLQSYCAACRRRFDALSLTPTAHLPQLILPVHGTNYHGQLSDRPIRYRGYLSDHDFVQSGNESFAETMARALGIRTHELKVCIAEGRIGSALLDSFRQPRMAADNAAHQA